MPRRRLIAIGASIVALGVGAWFLLRSAPTIPVSQTGAVAEPVAATGSVDATDASVLPPPPAATARTSTPSPSVPARNTDAPAGNTAMPPALRDEIAELDRRARAGDASAACRMAAELLACERARTMQPYASNVEAQARMLAQRDSRPEEIDRQIDAALLRQAENAAALARCEGIDATQWPPSARYFGLAAQAGHRPSMVQFLVSERYRSDQLFRDPGLIPLFRANAPRYFLQLVEAGDIEMMQRWALTAGLPHDILFDVLPPPWNDRGLAAAMMQQSLLARGIPVPDVPRANPPTPEQQALAAQLYARHFAANAADQDVLRQRMAQSAYDLSQYRCDEAPGAPVR